MARRRAQRTGGAAVRRPPRATSWPARAYAELRHDLLDILPDEPLVARVAQEIGGRERRHQLHAVVVVPAAAQLRDRGLHAEQGLDRELPERGDHLLADALELPEEEGLAALHLVGLWIAVLGRPALDDVGDVDVLAPELHPLGDDLGEQLPRPADERLALQVLVPPRSLPHEHQTGTRIAHTEDEMRAMGRELAPVAVTDVGAQLLQAPRRLQAGAHEQVSRGGLHARRLHPRHPASRKAEDPELALMLDVGAERAY